MFMPVNDLKYAYKIFVDDINYADECEMLIHSCSDEKIENTLSFRPEK